METTSKKVEPQQNEVQESPSEDNLVEKIYNDMKDRIMWTTDFFGKDRETIDENIATNFWIIKDILNKHLSLSQPLSSK